MATSAARTRTPAQTFALVFGAVYLLVGLVGFAVTGFDGFAADSDNEKLIIFTLNPLHNIVHIAIGAAWLASSGRHDSAKQANTFIGAAYVLVALLGFIGVLGFLTINEAGNPDNFLHLVSGGLSLYFGTAGAEGPGRTTGATTV